MANITITVPDDKVTRIRDALRTITGDPTAGVPELKAWLIGSIRGMVKEAERRPAIASAISTIDNDVDGIAIT